MADAKEWFKIFSAKLLMTRRSDMKCCVETNNVKYCLPIHICVLEQGGEVEYERERLLGMDMKIQ